MKFKRIIFFVLILLAVGYTLKAQPTELVATSAAGGDYRGSGGSISFTIGQVVYTTIFDPTIGYVSQGVQQPYDITVIFDFTGLDASIYPNPTTDYVILNIKDFDITNTNFQGLHYNIFNLNGKPLGSAEIFSAETSIALGYLPCATYVLQIVKIENGSTNDQITFKIIKY